jgi:hypothetical protein
MAEPNPPASLDPWSEGACLARVVCDEIKYMVNDENATFVAGGSSVTHKTLLPNRLIQAEP